MKTVTYEAYTYDELDDDAKAKVLEQFRDIETEADGWYDGVYEQWKETLDESGYERDSIEIQFTGFWSQGDGASFTANVDLKVWLRSHKLYNQYRALYNKADEVSCKIVRTSSMYVHEMTITCDIGDTWHLSERAQQQADEVEKLITQDARALSRKLYRALEDENDYLTSDEVVVETILANEYTFTKGGSRSVYLP